MANNIKGITIQIGGDTTKLDKALAGTNKQIKTTQSELKAVEKALKLDPGNTTLLAQKQRLLADGVGQTAEKLKTLKQAAETADEALARGKNYEAKYEPLQAKVEETTKSLQALVAQQGDMEAGLASGKISGEAYDNYNQAVAATKQQLADLQQQQKDVEEEFAGAKLNQQQYDALQREIVETTGEMKKLASESGKTNEALIVVGNTAGKIADKTKGFSLAAGGVATALTGMAYKAGLAADDLNTLSKQSGFSTDTIQKWQYASDLIDVSIDDIIGAARKMEKNMASTSETVTNAWKRLGVGLYDTKGNFRDAEDVFNDTLTYLSLISNETERDTLAMTLFGKSANDLAGIIDDGGAALKELGQEAEDMGLIMSQDALDGANKFNDALDKTKAIVTGELLQSGAQLAESLTPALESIARVVTTVIGAFAKLPSSVQTAILTMALMGATVSPIAKLVSNITGAIQGVSAVSKVFNATAGNSVYLTFAKWALIIMGVVAVMTALLAVIAALTGKGKDVERTMNSIGSAVSGVGNINKPGGAAMHSMADLGTPAVVDSGSVPYLAQGGVARANNPFLAVVGDNRREDEIIAPETVIKQWTVQGIQESGLLSAALESWSRTGGNATMQLDGRTFARLIYPYLQAEARRMGTTVKL